MFFQGLFRIIKWIFTGDSRTVLAEKHDTRPDRISFRIVVAVAGVLGVMALIVFLGNEASTIGDFSEIIGILLVPGIVALLLLSLVVFIAANLVVGFLRWLGSVPSNPRRITDDARKLGAVLKKELRNPLWWACAIFLLLAYINKTFIAK